MKNVLITRERENRLQSKASTSPAMNYASRHHYIIKERWKLISDPELRPPTPNPSAPTHLPKRYSPIIGQLKKAKSRPPVFYCARVGDCKQGWHCCGRDNAPNERNNGGPSGRESARESRPFGRLLPGKVSVDLVAAVANTSAM